jgi:hypothetical protein
LPFFTVFGSGFLAVFLGKLLLMPRVSCDELVDSEEIRGREFVRHRVGFFASEATRSLEGHRTDESVKQRAGGWPKAVSPASYRDSFVPSASLL